MKTLCLCCALLLLLTACDSKKPTPQVSFGDKGQLVSEKPSKTTPEPIKKTAEEPIKEPTKEKPTKTDEPDEVERITALQDPSEEQYQLLALSKRAMSAEDDDKTIAILEQIQDTGPLSGVKLSAAIALADLYQFKNQHDKAIKLLETIQRRAPPTPALIFVLARSYKAASRPDEAILAFKETLRLQPLFLSAHTEIGGIYLEQGNGEQSASAYLAYERAISKYSKLLEAPDTHPTDKLKIAEAFSLMSDDRAIEALLRALNDPNPKVRLTATESLEEIATQAHLPKLREARLQAKDDPAWATALDKTIKQAETTPPASTQE